jgi:hypothetical protein
MGKTISAKLIARAVLVSSSFAAKGTFLLLIAGLPKGHFHSASLNHQRQLQATQLREY